jgi:hypothetical protein
MKHAVLHIHFVGMVAASRAQAALERSASERPQWKRRNGPTALCSFAGTAVTSAPRLRDATAREKRRMPTAAEPTGVQRP